MAWVFIEETETGPAAVGLEILTKARELGSATVIYFGAGWNYPSGSSANMGLPRSFTSHRPKVPPESLQPPQPWRTS